MTIDCLNASGELEEFELPEDGRLTPQLRWVLVNSHCHSFALAIRRLTRWPLVGKTADGELEHVFCQMPDGKLVDAEGAMKSPDELFETQNRLGLCVLDSSFEFLPQHGWLKPIDEFLTPFARHRLEELNTESEATIHPAEYPFFRS